MTWPIKHLTADDLDAFHSASLNIQANQHLEECAECRALAQQDRALLAELAKLPAFEPRAGFSDRVMARVTVSKAAPVSLRPRRLGSPLRVGLATMLVLTLGASVIWSLLNRALLLSWLQLSAAETGRAVWLGVRVVATNLTAQSWYAPLRDFASSPGRLAAVGAGLLLGYGAALVALRRLLTPPTGPVSHANG